MTDVIVSVISGFFGGYFSIYLAERTEKRKTHFKDIKDNVLKPISEELKMLIQRLEIWEDRSIESLIKYVENDIKWTDVFSLKNRVLDEGLYEDLKNHFPELAKKYELVNAVIRKDYLKYLDILGKVYSRVKEELEQRLKAMGKMKLKGISPELALRILEECTKAVIMSIEGHDKYDYPTIYKSLKSEGLIQTVNEVVEELSKEPLVKDFVALKQKILRIISDALKETKLKINYQGKLPHKCPYL